MLLLADYIAGKIFHPLTNEKMLCQRQKYHGKYFLIMGDVPYAEHSSLTENGLIIRDAGRMTYILRFKNYKILNH